MARNTYKEDELLEEPFDVKHLLRAWVYIKQYSGRMILALVLSAIGGAAALVSPMLIERALDVAIPAGDRRGLVILVLWLVFFYAMSVIFFTIRSPETNDIEAVFTASQSSRLGSRERIRNHFSRGHAPREKFLSRSGLRQSKLHIVRFGPRGQSSFISLLFLFKIEAPLQF